MADLVDIRPSFQSIAGYGGDTLSFSVTIPAGTYDGYQWLGQIRSTRIPDGPVDATFTIVQPPTPGAAAHISLSSADTRALADKGMATRRTTPDGKRRDTMVYTGDYDIQVKPTTGDDPTVTLMQGVITIDMDVSRPE